MRLSNNSTGSTDDDGTDFGLGANGNLVLWNKENTAFHLATNNIERFHITAAGNVGIGTTAPSSDVEIARSNAASTLTLSSWDADTIGNVATLKFTKSASNTIQTFAATGNG